MKELIIIGARGFGRETYVLATECLDFGVKFTIKGFLDDKFDALDSYSGYPPILGAVETYEIKPNDIFICARGDVRFKEKYAQIILEKGGDFISLVHPTAFISHNVIVGKGCIICRNALVSCDVKVDDFVTVQSNAVLGHDSKIGKWSILDSFTFLGGGTVLGKSVTVHTGAKIAPRLIIKDAVVVGMGSAVIRNVETELTVVGVPARVLAKK